MGKEKKELQETKGKFKVIGKVTRIDKDGSFKEDVMDKPNTKNDGRAYRSLRFGVKTSETNEITVSSFDYEPEQVFMWNSEKKKNDSSYKGDRVPFGEWEEREEQYRNEGYVVLQSRIGLDYDDKGKLRTRGLPRYVAALEIYEGLDNGDSVVVEGTIRYSKYTNRNDEVVEQKNYTIERLFKIKDVDFEDEKFEEVSYFEQQMVMVDTDVDKKEGKAYVTGRVIDFGGNYEDTQFIIDFNNEDGEGYDQDMVKLADAFKKKIKFGDVVDVYGDTINKVIIEETEDDEEEEDDLISSLGGKSKPKHAQSYTSRTYITEMQIHGVEALEQGVYEEEDFEKDGLIEEDNDTTSEFGGKKKKDDKNPFTSDDEDDGIIDEDSLPF